MSASQNGWPVVDRDRIVDRAVLGVEFPNGWLSGDVDVVFTHLIGRLHREVEPIDNGGCWGYFVKRIEGSTTYSNHASGTAIDYNAPAHPMGVRNTYSASDRAKVRAILSDLDGVVRWGGDYTGRPDDMHFEINKGRAAVAALAKKIKGEAEKKIMDEEITLTDGTCDALGKPRGTKMTGAMLLQYAALHAARASKATAGLDDRLAAIEARLPEVPPAG